MADICTFLILGQAEIDVPAWHENHIILKILALDFGFLHNHNIRLQDIEHRLEGVSSELVPGPSYPEDKPGKYGSLSMADTRTGSYGECEFHPSSCVLSIIKTDLMPFTDIH